MSPSLRWSIYWLLILVGVGGMLGRILAVNSVDAVGLEKYLQKQGRPDWQKSRPFLSANDRSRWNTARSLVEYGTYEIDEIVKQPGWDTIDMVKHVGDDGQPHLYSSKPPLMATLMAGEYWIIHKLTGRTLGTHPYEIGRFMTFTINVLPLVLYFLVLASLAERIGTSDWGRIYMLAAAVFGTFLTTFAITINNHIPAAVCAALALWAVVKIWYDGDRRLRIFALAGLSAAMLTSLELPALSLFALITVVLVWRFPRESLVAYMPAALVIVVAHFGTNYVAHGSLREPYAHRSKTDPADNWYDYSYERNGKEIDSYWRKPSGIDKGEPTAKSYAVHTLIGHHGVFSLTPIWLLSVWGLTILSRERRWRELSAAIALVSLVCLAFYLSRPQIDRNYGGMTSGLRWMFWFAPLWLVALLPAADSLSTSRAKRALGLVLLALSVLSVSYPTWNPWTQPWITNFLVHLGWVKFD